VRLQYPLHKLFLILAAYAAALGVTSYLGDTGIAIGLGIATAAGALILAVRGRKDVLAVVVAASGSVIGALLAYVVLCPPALLRYTTTDAVREGVTMEIGAIAGGVLFSWGARR
jgi:hypothetical protein